jgi:hypothetical protein
MSVFDGQNVFDVTAEAAAAATWRIFVPSDGTEVDTAGVMKSVTQSTSPVTTTFTFNTFTAAAAKCPVQTGTYDGYRSYAALTDDDGEPVLAGDRVVVLLRVTPAIPGTKAAGLVAFGVTSAPTAATASGVGLAGVSHSFGLPVANPGAGAFTGGAHNSSTSATLSVVDVAVTSGGATTGSVIVAGYDTADPPASQIRQSRNSNFSALASAPLYLSAHCGAVSAIAAGVEDSQIIARLEYRVIRMDA